MAVLALEWTYFPFWMHYNILKTVNFWRPLAPLLEWIEICFKNYPQNMIFNNNHVFRGHTNSKIEFKYEIIEGNTSKLKLRVRVAIFSARIWEWLCSERWLIDTAPLVSVWSTSVKLLANTCRKKSQCEHVALIVYVIKNTNHVLILIQYSPLGCDCFGHICKKVK